MACFNASILRIAANVSLRFRTIQE